VFHYRINSSKIILNKQIKLKGHTMRLFFILLALTGLKVLAEVKPEVRPHMQEFYNITSQIQPYLLNKADYMNSKNEAEIAKALVEFKQKTLQLKMDKMAQSDDMKFRARQLSEGLDEAEQSFKNGFKDYSYWVLKSSFNNCFTCHTQKGLGETGLKFTRNQKASDFANAEFLFIVRNYSESIPLFEKIVVGYPDNKASVEELESSLQKILYYSVRVLRDDKKTEELFERLLKNNQLPSTVRNDVLSWQSYLKIKKYRVVENKEVKDESTLEQFLKERSDVAGHYKLGRQKYIVDLETSHTLFQLLEKPSKNDLKPWILLGLSEIEKDYRTSMFDLSVEQYLKECIEIYPKSPAAKKCLTLFKEIKKDAYTGSRGTDLPKSVIDMINKYEKLINNKK